MNKNILVAIIAAAVVVPAAVYAVSPYFTETTIDEPSPIATSGQDTSTSGGAVVEQDSMEKDDDAMMEKDGDAMMEKDDGAMMEEAMTQELSGGFQGAGDGIHNASGKATVLHLEDGSAVLRFENFRVTNGPDLYVYLSTDRGASDYIDLGELKASSGNQNYELPDGVDLSKYDNVIIWCKAFSVYFGGAELSSA